MTSSSTPSKVAPTVVFIGKDRGYKWDLFVNQGSGIVFSFQWETRQLLMMRLVDHVSYSEWMAQRRTGVDVWASVYGYGAIRGSLVPPSSGGWVVLLDHVPASQPAVSSTEEPTPLAVWATVYSSRFEP